MTQEEFIKVQEIEASTWCLDTPEKQRDKVIREKARYPMMAKQMGLIGKRVCVDTSDMTIYDIGCGPINGGLSSILHYKDRLCIDPNKEAYSKCYDVNYYDNTPAEELEERLNIPDLIISTNYVDHFKDPIKYLTDLSKYMKYGAFFCHFHGIDNAIQHQHPAHKFNLNEELVNEILNKDFELVWQMNYSDDGLVYSWLKEKSFCQLWRRVNKPIYDSNL